MCVLELKFNTLAFLNPSLLRLIINKVLNTKYKLSQKNPKQNRQNKQTNQTTSKKKPTKKPKNKKLPARNPSSFLIPELSLFKKEKTTSILGDDPLAQKLKEEIR